MFSFWAAEDDFPVWRFHPSALRRVLEDTLGRMGTGGMTLSLLIVAMQRLGAEKALIHLPFG